MKTKHVKSTAEERTRVVKKEAKLSANKLGSERNTTNEAQLMLLQLFDNQSLTDKQLVGLRKIILRFLVEEMDTEAEQVLQQKKTTAKQLFEQDSSQSRTERLTQIRSRS